MINKLSLFLARKLYCEGKIEDDEIDLYTYGLFVLISQVLLLLVTFILGLLLSCAFESIVLYVSFQSIRKFAGGYHASTETRCEIMSTLSMLMCLAFIRLSKTYDFQSVLLILTLIATVWIFAVCPLDTPEKPLTKEEYTRFRTVSRIILFVIATVISLSAIFKLTYLLFPTCISLILESVLLAAGKIKESFFKENNDREQSLRNISP